MSQPVFDFTHALNGLKNWPNVQPVDYSSVMATTDAPYALAGRVVHLNSTGLYELGASGLQIPLLLLRGPNALDVSNSGGTAWTAGLPAGQQAAIVATDAFEIETTEFDTTTTFAPNAPLKAPTLSQCGGATGGASAGVLFTTKTWPTGATGSLTAYTDTIVGFVSRGNYSNNYKVPVLAFWTFPILGTA